MKTKCGIKLCSKTNGFDFAFSKFSLNQCGDGRTLKAYGDKTDSKIMFTLYQYNVPKKMSPIAFEILGADLKYVPFRLSFLYKIYGEFLI